MRCYRRASAPTGKSIVQSESSICSNVEEECRNVNDRLALNFGIGYIRFSFIHRHLGLTQLDPRLYTPPE